MVYEVVGFDGGKQMKSRKRLMTVDTLGLVLRVLVTAASVPEKKVVTKSSKKSNRWGNSGS
jgi:hypothetical protein